MVFAPSCFATVQFYYFTCFGMMVLCDALRAKSALWKLKPGTVKASIGGKPPLALFLGITRAKIDLPIRSLEAEVLTICQCNLHLIVGKLNELELLIDVIRAFCNVQLVISATEPFCVGIPAKSIPRQALVFVHGTPCKNEQSFWDRHCEKMEDESSKCCSGKCTHTFALFFPLAKNIHSGQRIKSLLVTFSQTAPSQVTEHTCQ